MGSNRTPLQLCLPQLSLVQVQASELGQKNDFFTLSWVQTQGLLCISTGIVLDTTPSISGRKFRMKSPTSFDFSEKDVSLWLEQRGRELDNWDALVDKAIDSLQPLSIFQEMDQRCRQNNRLTFTTMAKFQALPTQNPQDNPPEKTLNPNLSTWDT